MRRLDRRLVAGLVFVGLWSTAPVAAERPRFGDALSSAHYARDRVIDVEHYRLDLRFDPEALQVSGTTSISLSPIVDDLASVELDAGPMHIESVTLEGVEDAEPLLFRHDGKKLRVALPRAYRAGESLTLSVRYSARPRAGLYFVGPDAAYPDRPSQVWSQGEAEDSHLWFPSYDYPNERATSEEIFTVPAAWTAIGNGALLRTTEDRTAGTRSFHYRMDVPHVAYLISVVAGELEKYTDEFDGIPVEYFVPVGTGREKTLRSFGPTPGMLRFFSERTGVRYPYAKYSQTCAAEFIFGGMENISATTQTLETLHDEKAALEQDSFGLVAHEAAHQWFGDLLTCADWSHAWLNEGFATYWEKLWWEHSRGGDEFNYRMLQARESYLEEDRDEYRRPIVQRSYTDPMDLFDSHLYPKGAWVLHMIRGILGDDAFWKAMQHYTRTRREQVVETTDLRKAIAEATGRNLERFFDQWLYHGGHPEFALSREWDVERQLLTLRLEQKQEVDDLTPLFTMPVDLLVETASGEQVHHRLDVERTEHEVTLRLDSEPLVVRFDPMFRVLAELDHDRPDREIVRVLETDPNPVGRIFAARDLARRAPAGLAARALGDALDNDAFYGVRIEAAKALGKVRGATARDRLVAGLKDPDARVRKATATALGEFRDDAQAARTLAKSIDGEQAYGPRAEALLSLAKIRAPEARKAAIRALGIASHRSEIRRAALAALGELGDPVDLPIVREWAAYGKPPRARTAAVEALAKLSPEGRAREEAVRFLVDRLDDPYIWVRREAMKALGKLKAEEARERLSRSAKIEADSRLRRAARRAILEIAEAPPRTGDAARLAAELERLREEVRRQSDRIELMEKQAP